MAPIPTWADTMDALRAPRERGQKLWEWRRESPIRPVVFEDTGKMDEDVVHLHLEHRIVRRLLGRFIAQGFVYHDLSRACLAQTSDAIPRVILLGPTLPVWPRCRRLHEELIPVTARWTDPHIRKAQLAPYGREAEGEDLAVARRILASENWPVHYGDRPQATPGQRPRDVQELLPHLNRRGEEYAQDAAKKLRERAEAEAKAMRVILETQKKHIAETAAKVEKGDPRATLPAGYPGVRGRAAAA